MITIIGILLVIVGWVFARSRGDLPALLGFLCLLGGLAAVTYGLLPLLLLVK